MHDESISGVVGASGWLPFGGISSRLFNYILASEMENTTHIYWIAFAGEDITAWSH